MESPLSLYFSSLQIDTKAFIWIKVFSEINAQLPFVTKHHNLLNLHQNFFTPALHYK